MIHKLMALVVAVSAAVGFMAGGQLVKAPVQVRHPVTATPTCMPVIGPHLASSERTSCSKPQF